MTKKELERKMEKVTKRQVAERNSLLKYLSNTGHSVFSANVTQQSAARYHDMQGMKRGE